MAIPKTGRSLKPKELLGRLARAARGGLISVDQAAEVLRLPGRAASARLASLVRRGWLTRARRGLYLVLPLESGSGPGVTVEDPWVLARELYSPCYIGGWTAAEHWGLTEQLFRSTFVVSAASVRRAYEIVLGTEFKIARVSEARLDGTTLVWRGRERVPISDRERTLADALASPDWVGGIRHLVDMLRSYRSSAEWNPPALLARLNDLNRGAAYKRLGYLAQSLWPEEEHVVEAALAKRSAGVIRLDPTVRSRGRMNKRWRLWINVGVGT